MVLHTCTLHNLNNLNYDIYYKSKKIIMKYFSGHVICLAICILFLNFKFCILLGLQYIDLFFHLAFFVHTMVIFHTLNCHRLYFNLADSSDSFYLFFFKMNDLNLSFRIILFFKKVMTFTLSVYIVMKKSINFSLNII